MEEKREHQNGNCGSDPTNLFVDTFEILSRDLGFCLKMKTNNQSLMLKDIFLEDSTKLYQNGEYMKC